MIHNDLLREVTLGDPKHTLIIGTSVCVITEDTENNTL